jgi:iron complex outermembrane receptor protein
MDHRALGALRRVRLSAWLGSVSLGVLGTTAALGAVAATAVTPVEEVLITGSLIHGAPAVGVPVTSISSEDMRLTGALTVGDLMRTVPAFTILTSTSAAAPGAAGERGTNVDLHNLKGERALLTINGMRYPYQNIGANQIDPGIIPTLAIDRVEVLADGASAVYGSDAVAGVINVILRRRFDGAITQARIGNTLSDGLTKKQFSQLYGTMWDGGDVTLTYEYNSESTLHTTQDRLTGQFTMDFTPWGLDNRTPITSSRPGVVSTGAPTATSGTGCTNCYSVPHGTGWDFGAQAPGPTTTWTTLLSNKGVLNQVNPYSLSTLVANQERNAAVFTFDQSVAANIRLFDTVVIENASIFVDAFYNNRRAWYFGTGHTSPGRQNVGTFQVPTTNPYYPTGAPSGLRVSYSLTEELNARSTVVDVGKRWAAGFNLDLPFDWLGRAFYSVSENQTLFNSNNIANANMISAALGNTVASVAANGTTPGQAAFTKPANVPFLNLFCDASVYACNSPATLAYINAHRYQTGLNQVHQWGASFDGPIWMLPAGAIRAAVGGELNSYAYFSTEDATFGSANTAVPGRVLTAFRRQVPAAFVQINAPIFGGDAKIPLFNRLELEGSYRYDHYYDSGVVWSPKGAFNWSPIEGLTIRGTFGKSFRAPLPSHLTSSNSQIQPANVAGGSATDTLRACPAGSATPVVGSAGEKLVQLGLATCSSTGAAALQFPGGISINTGTYGARAVRPWDGAPGALQPEKSTNTSIGATFAPTFIPGLDLELTYFRVKVTDFLFNLSISSGSTLLDPNFFTTYIFPDNPNFAQAVQELISDPISAVPPANAGNIRWISDGAFRNVGYLLTDGFDFRGEYSADLGNWGAWNAGLSGTYYLKRLTQTVPNTPAIDSFDTNGQALLPRIKYRAHLGWTDGHLSSTLFVNYTGHYFTTQIFPPAAFLTNFPNYSNIQPAFATLDLAIGYNTADLPANTYLQNMNIQLIVQDVLDKRAPFAYIVQTQGANPNAFDSTQGNTPIGRYFTLIVTKTW